MQHNQPKECRVLRASLSSKILFGILLVGFLAITFCAVLAGHDINSRLILLSSSIPIILLFLHLSTHKVEISNDEIATSSAFSKRRQLSLQQIKYYQITSGRGTTVIAFIPKDKVNKRIMFVSNALSKDDEEKVMAFARSLPKFWDTPEGVREQERIGILIAVMWFSIIIGAAVYALYVNWPSK